MYVLAIDVGASKMALGLIDEFGRLEELATAPTPAKPAAALAFIEKVVGDLSPKIEAIGIGVPGPLNVERGIIEDVPNLPGWRGFAAGQELKKKFAVPIFVENDAHCGLLGELWQGAAKGKNWVMMLTLGSGVGGALWRNGKLWYGPDGRGAELGHIVVDPNWPDACAQGHRGCLESLIGGFVHRHKYGKDLKELFKNKKFVAQWTAHLALGITVLAAKFEPELIVLGGGVVRDANFFMPVIDDLGLPVVVAKLGTKAGLVGAGFLAIEGLRVKAAG